MSRGSSRAGLWSPVPCQRRLGRCRQPHAGGRSGYREDAWHGPLHARCHDFTHFLPLAVTGRAKATLLPAASAPCRGGGFAHGNVAPGSLEVPSRHVPVLACPHAGTSLSLLSPRFPLCLKSLTHPSRGRRPGPRCSAPLQSPACGRGSHHLPGLSVPLRGGWSWPLLLLLSPASEAPRSSGSAPAGSWPYCRVSSGSGQFLPHSCVPDGDGDAPRLHGCSPAHHAHPCLCAGTSCHAQGDAQTLSHCGALGIWSEVISA